MNRVRITRSMISMLAAGAAVLSLHTQAGAMGETVVSSRQANTSRVSYEDLDLSSAKGQESLYFRLSNAARKVCGSSDIRITGSLATAAENQACYKRALNDALSQVNSGRLAGTQ